ncbi:MAG: site-specific DNA-methyltransferase, partial [Prolixibacteraceae bacterium]|nr:site-specific DNA-methyltransferase [Prolixibacteraceae bacterium]
MIKDILQNNEALTPNSKTLEVLQANFPQCFNKEGFFDIDKFKDLIKADVDITHEGYDLNFLGKNYAKLLASIDTTTVIQPDVEHNAKPENANSQNLYISGDNLDGLKHLLKSYTGAVKCIYIDPPYNTGSDGFVYNDKFNFTPQELIDKLSISEEQAQKIFDLTTKGRASHSAWLTFMYPRLLLARDLLTPDGVIFISIDDNEQANLKLICDSVFGEENFESTIIPIVNPGGRDYKQVAVTNEYLLCYSKSESSELNEIPKVADFSFNDSMGGYNLRELRNRNPKFHSGNRPNLFYPFYVNPNINENGYCATSLNKDDNYYIEVRPFNSVGKESVWRWGVPKATQNIVLDNIDKSQILAKQKKDGNWNIYEKNRKSTSKVKSLWDETEMRTEEGTRELRSLFGETYFDHPKPVELIKRCALIGSNQDDIILDFFSGSATTAQSIFSLNAEKFEEKRSWNLNQMAI